jgi:hypothetical protein
MMSRDTVYKVLGGLIAVSFWAGVAVAIIAGSWAPVGVGLLATALLTPFRQAAKPVTVSEKLEQMLNEELDRR